MPMLVVQIPPRQRFGSRRAGPSEPVDTPPREYRYAFSGDGVALQSQGRCAAVLLPKADEVVAVLATIDVAWHRIVVPQAPGARLRSALAGVVEEALLDDTANTHLALAPRAAAGQTGWLAACDRRWLRSELALLEAADVFVDRIVPAAAPGETAGAHFGESDGDASAAEGSTTLVWSGPDGVATLLLEGGLARAIVPRPLPADARLTATPAAAAAAERWVDGPVEVQGVAERLLEAARSPWNLRQFEFARRARGLRALADAWRQWWSPGWRPARIGLAALALVQLAGMNLAASQQRSRVEQRKQSMVQLLQTTFPQVRAVLDAPLQMQREVQALRTLAGKPGEDDLEPMLAAAAAAWPVDRPPVDSLRFEPGRLSLAAAGWQSAEVERFRSQLAVTGWQVEFVDGRLTLRSAGTGARKATL